ncbi:hypothetical protein MMPV_002894 [Pyropia vietnamensis]
MTVALGCGGGAAGTAANDTAAPALDALITRLRERIDAGELSGVAVVGVTRRAAVAAARAELPTLPPAELDLLLTVGIVDADVNAVVGVGGGEALAAATARRVVVVGAEGRPPALVSAALLDAIIGDDQDADTPAAPRVPGGGDSADNDAAEGGVDEEDGEALGEPIMGFPLTLHPVLAGLTLDRLRQLHGGRGHRVLVGTADATAPPPLLSAGWLPSARGGGLDADAALETSTAADDWVGLPARVTVSPGTPPRRVAALAAAAAADPGVLAVGYRAAAAGLSALVGAADVVYERTGRPYGLAATAAAVAAGGGGDDPGPVPGGEGGAPAAAASGAAELAAVAAALNARRASRAGGTGDGDGGRWSVMPTADSDGGNDRGAGGGGGDGGLSRTYVFVSPALAWAYVAAAAAAMAPLGAGVGWPALSVDGATVVVTIGGGRLGVAVGRELDDAYAGVVVDN